MMHAMMWGFWLLVLGLLVAVVVHLARRSTPSQHGELPRARSAPEPGMGRGQGPPS